jgi:four helix bundle protein
MTRAEKIVLVKEAWDLDVFKRAYRISLDIHKISNGFPKDELFGLTNQLRRCTKSVCSNLAEGFAKQQFSKAEFKRFITMSVGSSVETRVWIRYCVDLGYLDSHKALEWANEYDVITKMLRKLHAAV